MSEIVRRWIPTPAFWYPVWVTLDGAGHALDPLEEALLALVRAGLRAPADLARELRVDFGLVESATQGLVADRSLAMEPGGLAPGEAADADPSGDLQDRMGFIAWNPRTRRPLLQLWLDPELPRVTVAPRGWRFAPNEFARSEARPPDDHDVEVALRLLPDAGDLRAFEPMGDGVREVDGARVHRLRMRPPARRQRASIWVPVEQRVQGPVVWRPSLVPMPEVETELDPAGWAGVLEAAPPEAQTLARSDMDEVHTQVAPGVLRAAGYESVEELQRSARAAAARDVGALDGMDLVAKTVETAFVGQILGEAAGADWRTLGQAWANVLEAVTMEVARRVAPLLRDLKADDPPEDTRSLARLLGPSWERARDYSANRDQLGQLKAAMRGDADNVGTRILALAVTVVRDRRVRRAVEGVVEDQPDLFEQLDRARDERNRVVHLREKGDPVSVSGFRARVLLLTGALSRLCGRLDA